MNIKTINDLLTYVETEEKAQRLINYINSLEKIINQYENNIKRLKLCNSDYYNQICTLSSKISLINKFINDEKNLIPLHIKDYINKILNDKTIKLGDYIDENLEI